MLERQTSQTGIVFYTSPLLARAGVPHGFSTRIGGISGAPFDSLNLGNPGGCEVQDDQQRIAENYRRFLAAVGAGGRSKCHVHQVHGGDVVLARRGHEFAAGANADALVSDDPQRVLAIRIADCVPILLATEDGAIVAAVHAGWRGVIADVVSNAVREMRRLSDKKILAAIGPCIDQCSFEVGPEVLAQFDDRFGPESPVDRNGNGKGHVDLRRAVKMQLMHCGLSADQIDTTDRCTFRDAEEFFSHRRDKGITGRLAAVIAPLARQ